MAEVRDFSVLETAQTDWYPPSLLFTGCQGHFTQIKVAGMWGWPLTAI